MASSYIEWDSPDINLDNETIMKAFFKDFDDMSVIKLATNLRSEMSFSNNKTLVTLLKNSFQTSN